jgi:hypothetical protein
MRGFFEDFMCTANCDLPMVTSTAKSDLRMAQPAQFCTKKHSEICFQKQAAFLSFA